MSKNHGRSVPVSYSQNFLTSRATIARLLRLTSIGKNDTVVEIGAGKGHITRQLLEKSGRVIASELDSGLCEALRGKLSGAENLRLISGDFLRISLPKTEYKVFSNIPFSITTDIIRKLTQDKNPPREAWLVMEKGAAKRFCGSPSDTLQSLLLKPFFDLSIVYHFRREEFHPKPAVDIVVLHIARKTAPDLLLSERSAFGDFVTHGMSYGMYGRRALLTKQQIAAALRSANLKPLPQSGDVLYVQWLCLFRCWRNLRK